MSRWWSAEKTVFAGLFGLLLVVGAVSTRSVTTTLVTSTVGVGCAALSLRVLRSLAPGPVSAFVRTLSGHPLRSGSRALELGAQQMLTRTALHAPEGRLLPYPWVVVQLNPADLIEIDGGSNHAWIDSMLTSAYRAQAAREGYDGATRPRWTRPQRPSWISGPPTYPGNCSGSWRRFTTR